MVKLIALGVLIVLGFVMIGTILKAAAWIGLIVVLVMVAHAGYSAFTKSSKT